MNTQAGQTFDFKTYGIASVLKLHRLAVPPYQREYAWEDVQVKQLYEDLSLAKAEHRDYFLGSIVAVPKEDEKVYEIIDGQQRLTTTAILLAAIRDYVHADGSAPLTVDSVESEFLSTIDRVRGERVPRLTLNVDDNAFFRELMTMEKARDKLVPTRISHKCLVTARNIARDRVKIIVEQFSPQHRIGALNDWLEFLEHGASVIFVVAPNGAQAYRMFETLNDRGMKTGQVDLVKSYLFGQADRKINEAQARWSGMRRLLEEIEDDDRDINFLRYTLIATREFTRASDVYTVIQKTARGETGALSFLTDLESFSKLYVAIFRTDSEHWGLYPPEVIRSIQAFNKFDIKPLRPLLLAIAMQFSPKEAATAFKYAVALSVRLLVTSSTRSGSIEEAVAGTALRVYKKEITDAKGLKSSLARVMPDDRSFGEAFSRASSSKADFARYYLRALENTHAGEAEPWMVHNDDPTQITLEHILPKTPDQATDWPEFDEAELQVFSRRLGNMCLIQKTPNSNAKSGDFESKRAIYEASPYVWTNEIAQVTTWSPQEIEARQKRMAAMAVKAWPN